MSETCEVQPTVVRNERGLSINGTRVTLYHIMDHVRAGRSAEEIHRWLPMLSRDQVADALAYIEAHRLEVDAEYETVVEKAEENRRRWEAQYGERVAQIKGTPPKPEYAAAWAKLEALRNGENCAE
jgi:uncharacterized protein (DUF433 family)